MIFNFRVIWFLGRFNFFCTHWISVFVVRRHFVELGFFDVHFRFICDKINIVNLRLYFEQAYPWHFSQVHCLALRDLEDQLRCGTFLGFDRCAAGVMELAQISRNFDRKIHLRYHFEFHTDHFLKRYFLPLAFQNHFPVNW